MHLSMKFSLNVNMFVYASNACGFVENLSQLSTTDLKNGTKTNDICCWLKD